MTFDPSLSKEKVNSINALGCGALNKVIAIFDEVFWDVDQYTFGVVDQSSMFPMIVNVNKYQRDARPTLVFMVGGNQGKDLESLSKDAILEKVIEAISIIFGKKKAPRDIIITVLRLIV